MRNWMIVAFLVISGSSAEAQTRPDTLRMTCQHASALVQSRGAVVLATGPNLYDRYVTGCNVCFDGEFLQPAWIKTTDSEQCSVGYVCRSDNPSMLQSCGITGYRGPSVQP